MAKYIVKQSGPLKGEVHISGAKNAVLPLMAAALLSDDVCIIDAVPCLRDVSLMKEILSSLGSDIFLDYKDRTETEKIALIKEYIVKLFKS